MRLVIAEKPSVAQSIAAVLGAKSRHDGYLEGGGYIVSWCFGHLAELADAAVYNADDADRGDLEYQLHIHRLHRQDQERQPRAEAQRGIALRTRALFGLAAGQRRLQALCRQVQHTVLPVEIIASEGIACHAMCLLEERA